MQNHYALFVALFMGGGLLIIFYIAAVMQLCDRLRHHHRAFFDALGGPKPLSVDVLPLQNLLRAFLGGSLFSLHDPKVSFWGCTVAVLAFLAFICELFATYLAFFG